jgi:hypothetical protein
MQNNGASTQIITPIHHAFDTKLDLHVADDVNSNSQNLHLHLFVEQI